MTATLDGVTTKKQPAEASAEAEAARELVRLARERGLALTGPDGLLKQLTKTVIETALNEEMTGHLGYEKHDPAGQGAGSGNVRNGTRPKTVLTDCTGPVELDVPRDRAGTFEPQIVRKRQRRLTGVDEIVLSLYAKGLTTGEISAHFAEIYGASVSKETVSRIMDKVIEEMQSWQNRPLDEIYAAVFIDAIVVKIRVLSPVVWSAGQEYAFSEQVQAGAAEHLAFEHLEPVDVALDRPGAVGQGEAGAHGVEVAAQVGGEGGQGWKGVVFDGGDPGVEPVAVAAGHHGGEGPDVAGEPVQVWVAAADAA
jgi:hypothetical protein